jgi:hypothetical protein
MRRPDDSTSIVTHAEPAWRDAANYLLRADLADFGAAGRYEQLWLRDLGGSQFELCCLPLFTYGYSLGDIVETKSQGGREVLGRVATPSGRGLIRLVFHGHGEDHQAIHAAIERSGCLAEWRGDDYVAIDVLDAIPNVLRTEMDRLHAADRLQWENAGSRDVW